MNINSVIQKTRLSNANASKEPLVGGSYVLFEGEEFYRITNSHLMPEFFMSLTTSSDHWMFISSRGALTAGRKDPDNAMFPYYSADKISDMADSTGPKTVLRVQSNQGYENWIPFQSRQTEPGIKRNLYKNAIGNKLIFEEVHARFQLCFRYQWTFAHRFGFVRSCQLTNFGTNRQIEILDGLQNLVPNGVDQNFQVRFSNLGDAYKRNELLKESGIGLFYLSSVPTDRAEPSEGLRCTVAWQTGLDDPTILLSNDQVDSFLEGNPVDTETDIRGRRGCYYVCDQVNLVGGESLRWKIVANINHDQTDVINLDNFIRTDSAPELSVLKEVESCQTRLMKIVSSVDGRQLGGDILKTNRHQSNALFNVMRGGYPAHGYQLQSASFLQHVKTINADVYRDHSSYLSELPEIISFQELIQSLRTHGDTDLLRIGLEYLPFTFGRRHGDPTRPWNTFSISTMNPDGSPTLDYQGNWRDIFQNWEALSHSYSHFQESMVFRFVNASTADGYNPYRVTKDGFEWETPDPNDPWANFGYWGDHQIIYLLKLLEVGRDFHNAGLSRWLTEDVCRYANVPYRIRGYGEILKDARNTVDFDFQLEKQIAERVEQQGSDGKLLRNQQGELVRVNLFEKLLITGLTKMSNFVPDGGIWLNTQRPEWNDANNALVGRGLSMVTVCHLRRYFRFMADWFQQTEATEFSISCEVLQFFDSVFDVLNKNLNQLETQLSASDRKKIVDGLSETGTSYREQLYNDQLSGGKSQLSKERCLQLLELCLCYLDKTILGSRRDDGLFHSYNLLTPVYDSSGTCTGFEIEYLYEMLEGQVAALSSGLLNSRQAVDVLNSLRDSSMYRADQQSYMLYPNRSLAKFVDKNAVPNASIETSPLVQALLANDKAQILRRDCHSGVHFNGDIRNGAALKSALMKLKNECGENVAIAPLIDQHGDELVKIYESMFDHRRFTGRSGTFFGYEGLGSIYWHMVSKLLLAAVEQFVQGEKNNDDPETLALLKNHCREIQNGIGLSKTPQEYGAFPTDPYSHTPGHAGVQQPGMTGQVKEDLLVRFLEIGIRLNQGTLEFDFGLFDPNELLQEPKAFEFFDLAGNLERKMIEANCFAFTFCQVPFVYRSTTEKTGCLLIRYKDGREVVRTAAKLTLEETQQLLSRSGILKEVEISIPLDQLS